MNDLKTTPLTGIHQALGAKMVDFAGFQMPVTYGSIMGEHMAVRERAGIFDVSHMGEFLVTGPNTKAFINEVVTNNCAQLPAGRLQYTVMCGENGTVVDDLLVYILGEERALLVVNASNIDKDFEHVSSFEPSAAGVRVENVSDEYALIAVQGPASRQVLKSCPRFVQASGPLDETEYYHGFVLSDGPSEILVSRTGYTGELGFEIFMPSAMAQGMWEDITAAGKAYGLEPIGLGARDTLRFEASYCLYGHEMNDHISPLEAGLGWVVKLKKDRFRGQAALREQKQNGPGRTLVGLEVDGRAIARQGYGVSCDGEDIGVVTSGAFAPALKKSLCMALIRSDAKSTDAVYSIDVRGRSVPAKLVSMPFYQSRAKTGKDMF